MAQEVIAPSGEEMHLMKEMAAGGLFREDQILARVPQWSAIPQLPSGAAETMRAVHSASLRERTTMIARDPALTRILLAILAAAKATPREAQQYVLALFHEVVRDDTDVLEDILRFAPPANWVATFCDYVRTCNDQYCRGKAAFLLAALVARAPLGSVDEELLGRLVESVASHAADVGEHAALDFLKNLLKQPALRLAVWNTPMVPHLILTAIDPERPVFVYAGLFCAWLASFDPEVLADFTKRGGVKKLCACIKQCRTEKVVRMAIRVLGNVLPSEDAQEIVIQEDLAQTLTLLEYENWRDGELFAELRDVQAKLNVKIKSFSSFDRYLRELQRGVLRESLLHEEKFWRENVMHFEENEFSAVRKLTLLLRSEDPETLAIACRDLGEFAHMHPTGKLVLQKFRTKDQILLLMNHKDRRVALEALLCLQKLMIEKWRDVAAPN